MKTFHPRQKFSNARVFTSLLISFLILVAPIAPLAAGPAPGAGGVKLSPLGVGAFDPAMTVVTATKTDSWDDTATPDGKAEPGQTITYDVNVSNTGAADATGVNFTDTIDPNTTLVPGSLRVSPLAFADSYNATINTPLSISAPGVLANDTGTPAPTAQPIAGGPTSQGGTVTLNADGSFNYTPPNATFQGADTFTYTATNGLSPNDTATVTINVDEGPAVTTTSPTNGANNVAQNSNITINFTEPVNATTGSFSVQCPTGSPQTFTLSASPSASFTLDPTADLPAGTTCTVTVFAAGITDADTFDPPDQMAADYTFSFGVKPLAVDDMRSATGNVKIDTSITGYSVLTNDQVPGGTISAFDATSANGGDVTMNTTTGTFTYNPPRGFTGTDSFNYTVSNGGGSDIGTVVLTVTDTVWFINNAPGACSSSCDGRLTNPYTSLAAFEADNGNGGADPAAGDSIFIYTGGGVYTGPVTLENNQIVVGQGAASSFTALTLITPAPDSVGFPSTGGASPSITTTPTSGQSGVVLAQNNHIHGLAFSNTDGSAVNGTANVGAFTMSEIAVNNTGTGAAGIVFTGGGGVTSTGVNTIATGNGTALNVTNTNIDAGGLTFQSISSSGGSNAGIVLSSTGSSGGLTVTGDGGGANNGSGGTITGKNGPGDGTDGVSLSNTSNVSLNYMNITNNNRNGVFATSVNGIRMNRCNITGNGNQATPNESNVRLIDISGTSFGGSNPTGITNSTVSNGFEHDIEINHGVGTLTDFQINNSTVSNNGASGFAANRVLIIVTGGSAGLTVQDSTVSGNRTPGALTSHGIQGTVSAGTLNVKAYRNLLQNNASSIDLSTSLSGVLNFDVTDNGGAGGVANNGASNGRITGSDLAAVSIFTNANSTGSVNGFIRGNTIGTLGVPSSGSVNGRGIQVQNEGSINTTLLISNNIVQQINTTGGAGINVQHGIAVAGAAGASNVTVINNTLRNLTSGSRALNADKLNTGSLCSDISGNVFTGSTGQGGGPSLLRVNRNATAGPHNVRQAQPTAAANAAELDDANGLDFGLGQVTVAGTPTFNGGACTQPVALAMNVLPDSGRHDELAQAGGVEPSSGGRMLASVLDRNEFVEVASLNGAAKYAGARSMPKARANFNGVSTKTDSLKASAAPRTPVVAQPFSGETVNANIGTLAAGKTVHVQFQVTVDNPFPGTQASNQGTISGDNFATVLTDDPSAGGSADPTITPILTPPDVTIKDASVAEPASGSAVAAFAVTLSHSFTQPITVNYTTASGGANPATAGSDYTTTSGTLTFNPGETVQTISVPVLADADASETNETFFVNISGATNGATITDAQAVGTITPDSTAGTVMVSELRTSGPAGADDEFVEIYNNTDSPITVAASDASGGWAIVKSGSDCNATPVVVAVIPNGTVIPARGNYLVVGTAYSLGAYAAGDQTLVFGIEDDHNVALFNTADLSNISTVTRLDAVGFGLNTGGNCDLLREGATLQPASGSTSEYSFVRKVDKGATQDTNDNAADFIVVSTTAGAVGSNASPTLGAPGPENSTGARGPVPCNVTDTAKFGRSRLDSTVALGSSPNTVRDATVGPNAANGTIDFRRRFTNNTGGAVTQLRFRITNMKDTSLSGAANLRALSSATIVVSVNDPATCGGPAPCNVTVVGTTLEQPPAQASGGGVNSTLGVGTITTATPLPAGASVNVRLLFGVQQTGDYHVSIVIETATGGSIGQDEWELRGNTETGGHTEGGCNTPPVANAGADQTIECGGASTSVTLDGTASSDADGDTLSYEWREGATVLGTTAMLNTSLAFGPHTITLKVTDPSGEFNEDTVSVNIVDTTDPLITAPPNVSVNTGPGASSCGAFVSDATLGTATASDGCSASVTITRTGVPAGNNFPVGTTIITYTADDGHGHTKDAFQSVTVTDNTPPVVTPPANINVNAPANSCSVSLDPGTATATDNCPGVTVSGVRSDSQPLNAPYPVGTTTITWTANDAHGNSASGVQTVKVNDATPPVIVLTSGAIVLGPPNHQYATLTLANLVASASDGCDASVDINDVVISQATSDEAEDAPGGGDGNTNFDIVIAPDCKSLQLRAERQGGGNGRVYKVTLKVKDSSGNIATAVRTIIVPQSGSSATDSGVNYTVNGCAP